MADQTRREFLKLGMAAAGSALVASAVEIPLFSNQTSSLKNQLSTANAQLSTANTQIAGLQTLVNTATGFISLSVSEQSLLEAIVETIIPSDTSGPGAKEAGVIHFIDRQLAADYGQSANMFMDGPFVQPGQTGSVTVNNLAGTPITYAGGTPNPRVGAGTHFQYPLNMREFWRICLIATQAYANSAYVGNFEGLTAANQLQVLNDLWTNKPTSFSNIIPKDFAYELTFMTWAGFLMDPIHGGNRNMVGWAYTGFNGVNFGNFYGEGLDQRNLMVATTPTRLKPASLAQFQQQTSGGP